MQDEEKTLTEHESLLIIQQMIQTAKKEQKDDGKGWIIWGWMLFIASAGTVINQQFQWFSTFFFWNVFGGLTILIGLYEAYKVVFVKEQMQVRTYTKDIFRKLNVGFFICLMFIIIGMNTGLSPLRGFPLLMTLYGFWILIYGALLNFKPSLVGAYVMWALAFIALFIPLIIKRDGNNTTNAFALIMVLHGVGVLCGYIIPGHIANNEFRKLSARKSV